MIEHISLLCKKSFMLLYHALGVLAISLFGYVQYASCNKKLTKIIIEDKTTLACLSYISTSFFRYLNQIINFADIYTSASKIRVRI